MTGGCRVECLDAGAVAAHGPAWSDLAARSLEASVFNEPAFALPAARFIPVRRPPRFLLVWEAADRDRLIGLCCVSIPPVGLPVTAWLHPQATAAFPLLDAQAGARAFEAMVAWSARGWARPAGLLLHGLPAEGETARLIASGRVWSTVEIERRGRAVLRTGEAVHEPAGKAGKEYRRQRRRLAEQGTMSVTSASTATAVAADLETFLRLEAAGWKGRRGTALAQSPGLASFARAMVAGLATADACRLVRLDVDGRTLAIGIVLRCRDKAYYWKTVYDEDYARFSPGVHLTEAIGQSQAQDETIGLTDSCAIPDHAMIDRLWPGRTTVVDLLVAPSNETRSGFDLALRSERMRRGVRHAAKHLAGRFR